MKVKKAHADDFQSLLSQLILMSGIIPFQAQNPAFVVIVRAINNAPELFSNNENMGVINTVFITNPNNCNLEVILVP